MQCARSSIAQAYEWVKKAWDDISTEIIVKSFKKCGISNALGGTEDDALFDSSSNEDFSGFECSNTDNSVSEHDD